MESKAIRPEDDMAPGEAAAWIGVTRQAINKLIRQKRIPAKLVEHGGVRYYLVKRYDLDYYVANRRHSRHMLLPAHYRSTLTPST